jgi:hypothetical protein
LACRPAEPGPLRPTLLPPERRVIKSRILKTP